MKNEDLDLNRTQRGGGGGCYVPKKFRIRRCVCVVSLEKKKFFCFLGDLK